MKEIDLYIFIDNNDLEYHWHDDDVILFVSIWNIVEWNNMLGHGIMDEEGIKCTMKDKYFCFWMKDICEYFNIDLSKIFKKDNEQ